jgi:hypothetical protein
MRIVKNKVLSGNSTQTEDCHFRDGEKLLTISPMQATITGLQLILKTVNGNEIRTPIYLEEGKRDIDISKYDFMYFTYTSTDKVYIIKTTIK